MELNERFFYVALLIYIFFLIIIETIILSKVKTDLNKEEKLRKKRQTEKNIVVFLLLTILPPWVIPILDSFVAVRSSIKLIAFVILFFVVSFAIILSAQIWMYIKLIKIKDDEN